MSILTPFFKHKQSISGSPEPENDCDIEQEEEKTTNKYTFNAEDREMSAITRSIQAQIRDLERTMALKNKIYQLKMLQKEMSDDTITDNNDTSMENIALQTLLSAFTNKSQPQQVVPAQSMPLEVELTDDEILNILNQNITPKQRKMARNMPSSTISKMIKARFPNLSEKTIMRGIELL